MKRELLLSLLDILIQGMNYAQDALPRWVSLKLLGGLARFLLLRHPALILLFVLVMVLAAVPIGVILAVHLVTNLVWRGRARVFISFQHDRESIASALAAEMARAGINPVKLPFVETPDHDILLDQVKQAIRDCDVFVCVPGSRPSFVQNEVSMAFGLEKPLLFVLTESDTPRLPNTAKKGYPVFALERVQREGLRTLISFCSYLAVDWRSTVRLYGAVSNHMMQCMGLCIVIYFVSMVPVMLSVDDWVDVSPGIPGVTDSGGFLVWAQAVVSNPLEWVRAVAFYPPTLSFIVTSLVLCLVTYGVFSLTRSVLRTKLRQVISGKKFSESFLPKTLDFSLTRADLLKILYSGDIAAEHESDMPTAHNT